MLWDVAVCRTLSEACAELAASIEEAQREAEARFSREEEQQAMRMAEERRLAELQTEVEAKEAAAAELVAQARQIKEENAQLLEQLTAQRQVRAPLESELRRLQAAKELRHRQGDQELAELEQQLLEAVDVQGALRFSLLQSQAEAEEALQRRRAAEGKAAVLRERLEDSRAAYVAAVEVLDRKVAALEREGYEAERTADRLERALENTSFRTRMAGIELQRWGGGGRAALHDVGMQAASLSRVEPLAGQVSDAESAVQRASPVVPVAQQAAQ